jgi:DNA-binding response OmpR family regulator
MTHREFEVLKYFWRHQNETISRDKLLEEVWGYDEYPTTRTVDNFILKLRQKIEDDTAHPRHILTVHGIGYKFVI